MSKKKQLPNHRDLYYVDADAVNVRLTNKTWATIVPTRVVEVRQLRIGPMPSRLGTSISYAGEDFHTYAPFAHLLVMLGFAMAEKITAEGQGVTHE